jgi:aspartate racemase
MGKVTMRWRTIGVIGGMGPAATADFMSRLVAGAAAARDSDHPRVLVDSNPYVPDRNAAIAGTGPSPGPVLAGMAANLLAQGAEVLAMPCNAAHGWADDVRAVAGDCFVDIIDTAIAAAMQYNPRRIGLIAIGATLDDRLYDRAPVPAIAADRLVVQMLVNRIKAGDTGAAIATAMAAIAAGLVADGADVIIAACTEVPLVLAASTVTVPLIDATAVLATATLAAARTG